MTRTEALAALDAHFFSEAGQTDDLRAALKALAPMCRERWPLDAYCEAAGREEPIGRWQTANASRAGIYRQLGLPVPSNLPPG